MSNTCAKMNLLNVVISDTLFENTYTICEILNIFHMGECRFQLKYLNKQLLFKNLYHSAGKSCENAEWANLFKIVTPPVKKTSDLSQKGLDLKWNG